MASDVMNMNTEGIPVEHSWIGGLRGGYALRDAAGFEVCRVWSEADAEYAVLYGYAKPESLVDEVINRRWPEGWPERSNT